MELQLCLYSTSNILFFNFELEYLIVVPEFQTNLIYFSFKSNFLNDFGLGVITTSSSSLIDGFKKILSFKSLIAAFNVK